MIDSNNNTFLRAFNFVKNALWISSFAVILAACSAKLPQNFHQKTLVEKTYVDNVRKDYILHLGDKTDSEVQVQNVSQSIRKNLSDSVFSLKNQDSRPYFNVMTGADTTVVANRRIDFKKPVNFRDLGGLKTKDGKTVKWGKIFRSDNLSKLKSKEFGKFNDLHIQTVYDLRTDHEIKGKEDHLPTNVKYVHAPTVKDNEGQIAQLRNQVIGGKISEEEAIKQTVQFYEDAVTVNVNSFRDLIHQIADSNDPVLYHCSAGKDRTGIVSALILSILNVDRETIMNEYLMSNYYRVGKNEKTLGKAKLAKVIKPKMDLNAIEIFISVDGSYMKAVFETINKNYGSMDQFIQNQLAIDDQARKNMIAKFTY